MDKRFMLVFVFFILFSQGFAFVEKGRVSSVLVRSVVIVPSGFRYSVVLDPRFTSSPVVSFLTVEESSINYPDVVRIDVPAISPESIPSDVGGVAIIVVPNIKTRGLGPLDDPLIGVVYDRLLRYALSRNVTVEKRVWFRTVVEEVPAYDYVVPLIGDYASVENLAALIYECETRGIGYGVYGVSHGLMNNDSKNGVLLYFDGEPALINARVLREYIKGYAVRRAINLELDAELVSVGEDEYKVLGSRDYDGALVIVKNDQVEVRGRDVHFWAPYDYVNESQGIIDFMWASCYIEDMYERFNDSSFPGFFDKTATILSGDEGWFKLFGRGITAIPQEMIDLLDQTVRYFRYFAKYEAAIVQGGTVVLGSFTGSGRLS